MKKKAGRYVDSKTKNMESFNLWFSEKWHLVWGNLRNLYKTYGYPRIELENAFCNTDVALYYFKRRSPPPF